MKISPATKISAIIKANPAAIDAIASINRHFEKLRNPLLRKVLAPRVTIADAARIGGTAVAAFLNKLEAIGFEVEQASPAGANGPAGSTTLPNLPADLPAEVVPLDVRSILQAGQDPFNGIMAALKALQPNQALQLINTFEPTPLFSIIEKKGFCYHSSYLAPNLVHTYVYRQATASVSPLKENQKKVATAVFQEVVEELTGNLREVDVRDMEMPQPMITILETLEQLDASQTLLVHHRRVPQFLMPQLRERGYSYMIDEWGPDQVQILIFKSPGHANAAQP
jgi:uncharacterized protein (DUF2249 family)